MTWVRIDELYAEHPKVVGLTDSAFRLHVEAICYANRHLTDGLIPPGWLCGRKRATEELIASELFEPLEDGGVRLHDFLIYQPSREMVLFERREKHEAKVRAGQMSGLSRRQKRLEQANKSGTEAEQNTNRGGNKSGTKTNPDPDPVPEEKNPPLSPRKRGERESPGFEEFWTRYPKKIGKGAVEKIWRRMKPEDRARALAAAEPFGRLWAPKPDKRYCPMPATWLNQGRWEDDPKATAAGANGDDDGPIERIVLSNPEEERKRGDWEANERMQADMEHREPQPYPFRGGFQR